MPILVTHAGSLPRGDELDRAYAAASRGEPVDPDELRALVERATFEVVARQAAAGIDVANNGEAPRESFFSYVRERLSGFGDRSRRRPPADMVTLPSYVELKRASMRSDQVRLMRAPACIGPVEHLGTAALDAELALTEQAAGAHRFAELFCTAASPGIVAAAMENRHYASLSGYVAALGEALAPEYRRIVERGHVLQIDAPDLAMERHTLFADRPLGEFLAFARDVVSTINAATAGLDPARVRLHVCWGNYDGPHTLDVELDALLAVLAEARVGALVLAQANPRHAHEVALLPELPPAWSVVLGVVDTTTNYVEHPAVVADRLCRAAEVLGDPGRLTAGTDCGFATAAGLADVAAEVAWLKLDALVAGTRIANERLFGR